MKHILLLVVICLSTLQVNSASTSRDSSIVPQIQNVSQTTSKSVNSQDNPDLKVKPIEKYIVISGNSEEKVAWYNILAPAAGIIGLIISIYSIRKSSRVSDRNNQLSNEVKKLEIKMRTSDLVVAKRLEVFPKLHILTDTLGAAIRYYKLHIEDEKTKNGIPLY